VSAAPDSRDTLAQAVQTTPFNGNGTIGRLLTVQVPSGPMLRRRPGICGERYERAKADFESQPFYVRWTSGLDRPVGVEPTDELMYARQFKEECERWPDEIPQSVIDDKRQQLSDHLTGQSPLPPEQSLKLRRDLDFLDDVYNPGPRVSGSLSNAEQAWLDERNLRFGNTMAISFLGPVFGGPGAATRVLGGSEQQVAAANQFGAGLLDAATIHTGFGGRRPTQPIARPGETARGAPLEPVSRPTEQGHTRPSPRVEVGRDGTVVVRPLPPGMKATDNKSIREWYNKHTSPERMKELDEQWKAEGKSPQERAELAFKERHDARMTARSYMQDPVEVEGLRQRDLQKYGSPDGPTFQQEVQKYQARGLQGDDIYQSIIDGASRTSAEYNSKFGITK
jgi:hypothetical protein